MIQVGFYPFFRQDGLCITPVLKYRVPYGLEALLPEYMSRRFVVRHRTGGDELDVRFFEQVPRQHAEGFRGDPLPPASLNEPVADADLPMRHTAAVQLRQTAEPVVGKHTEYQRGFNAFVIEMTDDSALVLILLLIQKGRQIAVYVFIVRQLTQTVNVIFRQSPERDAFAFQAGDTLKK